jgi:hypothetical protein
MELTPDQAAVAQNQAVQLQGVLEQQIIGKQLEGWQCNCGAVHVSDAKAVKVVYPEDEDDNNYMKVLWYSWNVKMQELVHPERHYSTGLDRFLSEEEINQLFAASFGDLIAIAEK